VDEEPNAGCGSLFQSSAFCSLCCASRGDSLAAWQWALEGQKVKGILLMHLVLGCTSSVLICFVFWIHLRLRRHPDESLPKYRLPIEALAVFVVALTGHLGEFRSGVNGPG
jgi:heme A synthase